MSYYVIEKRDSIWTDFTKFEDEQELREYLVFKIHDMSYDKHIEASIFNNYLKKPLEDLIKIAIHHVDPEGILGVVMGDFIGSTSDRTTYTIIKRGRKLSREWVEIDEETDEVRRWVVCLV